LRRQKKIKECVDRNRASLQQLLNDIGEQQVLDNLQSLLERRIFESEVRAKTEFPDLFRPSPFRDIQHQAFEDDAARSTEEALDSIVFCHMSGLDTNCNNRGEPVKKEHGKLEEQGKPVKKEHGKPEEQDKPAKEEHSKPVKEEHRKPVKDEPRKPVKDEPRKPVKDEPSKPVKEEHSKPVKNCGEPVKEDHGKPVKEEHDEPVEGHGEPVKEEHDEPVEGHGEPVKGNGEPAKNNGQPVKEDHSKSVKEDHGKAVKDRGEPVKDHGEPVKDHGEPVKLVNGEKKAKSLACTCLPESRCPYSSTCLLAEVGTETGLSRHDLPSLYPSYLPYQTQHLILTTVQQILEECCFDFATAAMPSVLRREQWECPMAVELTKWTELFRKGKAPALGSNDSQVFESQEVHETLTAVSHLRHTAVHRLHITARAISQLLDAAVKLAEALQDNLRAAQLDELRFDINIQIKSMELSKNVLEDTVSAELQRIQRRREELERMETDLIQSMLDDDANNRTLIGRLLEDSVHRIFKRKKQGDGNEKEKQDDRRETGWKGGTGDGKTSEHEESDGDDSSGYETTAEEQLSDAD
jgi:hypothetical protein